MPTGESKGRTWSPWTRAPRQPTSLGGLALATVPEWDSSYAFATQGPYLHVISYDWYPVDKAGTEWPICPDRTIDLVEDLGWPEVHLTGVAAGDAITINGKTIYPLYVVGYVPGVITHPYVMIFDQEA